MKTNNLTQQEIANVEELVVKELKMDFSKQSSRNLNLPGLETILILIASKVVIPVVVSIAGRWGYDVITDWRKGKIKKEEIIKQAIDTPKNEELAVTEEKLINDIAQDLEKEGISKEISQKLTRMAIEKLASR